MTESTELTGSTGSTELTGSAEPSQLTESTEPTDHPDSAAADDDAPRRQHSTLSSVRNAARLLKEFSGSTREIGVTELARRLGIGKSTAHRLLHTLTEERLLERDPDTGAYRLGLAMYELGNAVSMHTDLHEACTPVLDDLRNATSETVQVAVLDGHEVVYVERRESPHTLRLFGRIGHRNAAHCTSTGKVLLAWLPAPALAELLDGWTLEAHTPYTITDPTALVSHLADVRRRGWALQINETEMGAGAVAAPVRNGLGEVVAAVSVAGPIQRVQGDSLQRIARLTVEAGGAISRRLGFHGAKQPGASASRT